MEKITDISQILKKGYKQKIFCFDTFNGTFTQYPDFHLEVVLSDSQGEIVSKSATNLLDGNFFIGEEMDEIQALEIQRKWYQSSLKAIEKRIEKSKRELEQRREEEDNYRRLRMADHNWSLDFSGEGF